MPPSTSAGLDAAATSEPFLCWSDLVVDGSKWEKRPKWPTAAASLTIENRERERGEKNLLRVKFTTSRGDASSSVVPSFFFFCSYSPRGVDPSNVACGVCVCVRAHPSRIVRQTSESHGREYGRSHLHRIGRFHRAPRDHLLFSSIAGRGPVARASEVLR